MDRLYLSVKGFTARFEKGKITVHDGERQMFITETENLLDEAVQYLLNL